MPEPGAATTAGRVAVAVVAAGAVSPFGAGLDAFWTALAQGRSAIAPITGFACDDLRVRRGGEVPGPALAAARDEGASRAVALVLAAAEDLRARAPITAEPARVAVVLGTALGGVERLERAVAPAARAAVLEEALYDAPARALARRLGAGGPVLTVCSACASGATALGIAADLLRADVVDVAVAGGYDALGRFVMRGFDGLRSLTPEEVRPFDRRRSGLLLGEGAALVLLARERDAPRARLGRLLGHGTGSDGAHLTAPDPHGRGLRVAVEAALAEAGLGPDDVQFVSAHGTGTRLNDRVEALVLRAVLGASGPPVNSIKGALGHAMGAAATLEAIMCLLAGRTGVMPATAGLEEIDPECDLDCVVGTARVGQAEVMLSTSLGFGGCNAALVLARA